MSNNLIDREITQGVIPIGAPKAYKYDAALVEAAKATVQQGMADIAEKAEEEKGNITEFANSQMKGYADSAAESASAAQTSADQLAAYVAEKASVTAPLVDPTLTISDAAADAKKVGDMFTSSVVDRAVYINSNNKDSICNGTMDDMPINTLRTVAAGAGLTNTPPGFENIVFGVGTFSCSATREKARGTWQIAVAGSTSNPTTYIRGYNNTWNTWKKLTNTEDVDNSLLPYLRTKIGVFNATTYGNKLQNITKTVCGFIVPSDYTDSPIIGSTNTAFCVLLVNDGFAIQLMFGNRTNYSNVYYRLIRTGEGEAVFKDWQTIGGYDIRNILAIGDSICRGDRNSNRGYVGLLGLPYINAGVSGATLASGTGHGWIEQQLIDRTEDTNHFDAIIMEGGVNDYNNDVPLGNLSAVPVRTTDTELYDALDTTTVLGAMEHLFVTLQSKYPNIDKFFLIAHKIRNWPYTKNYTGGYTQDEMHDAMVACCRLYNVQVIDIYAESPMNSYFPEYVSPTDWADDHTITDLYWVNSDRVHPLNYGYIHGYVPFIQKALKAASHKS